MRHGWPSYPQPSCATSDTAFSTADADRTVAGHPGPDTDVRKRPTHGWMMAGREPGGDGGRSH
jgi:hypothetical protein